MFPTLLPSTWHSCWRLGFHHSNHCSVLHPFSCGCCYFMESTFLQWKSVVYGLLLLSHLVASLVWEDISKSGLVIIWCFSAAHRFLDHVAEHIQVTGGLGQTKWTENVSQHISIHWTQAGLTTFKNSINRNFLWQYTFENTLSVVITVNSESSFLSPCHYDLVSTIVSHTVSKDLAKLFVKSTLCGLQSSVWFLCLNNLPLYWSLCANSIPVTFFLGFVLIERFMSSQISTQQ